MALYFAAVAVAFPVMTALRQLLWHGSVILVHERTCLLPWRDMLSPDGIALERLRLGLVRQLSHAQGHGRKRVVVDGGVPHCSYRRKRHRGREGEGQCRVHEVQSCIRRGASCRPEQ